MPASIAARAVIILKVEPGGYWPRMHLLTSGVRGLSRRSRQVPCAQTAGERGRVVARHGGQRHHPARAHVDDDRTGRELGREARDAEALQLEIQGQAHVGAGHALAAVELADLAADRVDLDPAEAGATAQGQVVATLDPALADAELGQMQQRIPVLRLLGRVHGPDIADDVGEGAPLRIGAQQAGIEDHAGQFRRMHGDLGDLAPVQILAHQ